MSFLRRHLKKLLAAVALLAVAGLVVSRRLQPVPVIAAAVARGTAVDAVYATGTVEAKDRIVVKAKATGSIAEVFVREGTPVKAGDLLARIDNPSASFDLKRGKADLSQANAQAKPRPRSPR